MLVLKILNLFLLFFNIETISSIVWYDECLIMSGSFSISDVFVRSIFDSVTCVKEWVSSDTPIPFKISLSVLVNLLS